MNPKAIISLLIVTMSVMMYGQNFPDRIITNDGDTIECCISLVNDQNIFYYHMKRDIRRPDKVSLSDISSYSWTRECNFKDVKENPVVKKEREPKKWGYGVKLVQQFNHPINHTIIAMNVRKGNHNFYAGPHYTHISKERILGDTEVSYSQNTYGLNLGYMIVIKTRNEVFDVFMQLDVSLYEAQKWHYNGPYSEVVSSTEFVTENCISVGIKYNISEKFETFGGYGIGSTDGFFFTFEEIVPHVYLGLQYNFK